MLLPLLAKSKRSEQSSKKVIGYTNLALTVEVPKSMNSYDPQIPADGEKKVVSAGKTIDLQGVAAFASLVELLAQELGTNSSRMQGHLPTGPSAFNQLIGEIDIVSQGFQRKLTLIAPPGEPLTLRFQSYWKEPRAVQTSAIGEVAADYYLGITVEQILPQGRALARYAEDIFAVLDRMVTLGQSGKLGAMSLSTSEIENFEEREGSNLVRQYLPKSK
jgi:hypothetical protein